MEGTVKYEVFIFILPLPCCQCCDYSKCSLPTVSPVLFVSIGRLQSKFSFTVPPGEHHCEAAHLLCVPTFSFTVYKSSLVVSWMLYYMKKHIIKCRIFMARSDTALLLSHYQITLLKYHSTLVKHTAKTRWKQAIHLIESIWSVLLISS